MYNFVLTLVKLHTHMVMPIKLYVIVFVSVSDTALKSVHDQLEIFRP